MSTKIINIGMLVYTKYAVQLIIVLITALVAVMIVQGKFDSSTSNLKLSNLSGDYPSIVNAREGVPRSERKPPNGDRDRDTQTKTSDTKTQTQQTLVIPPSPALSPSSGGSSSSDNNAVTKVKTPGFEVEISEGVTWMTVFKLLSILLIGYLGIKMTNFVFHKLKRGS